MAAAIVGSSLLGSAMAIAAIPSGWALCNGSNGTPDLRDRFIIGATQDDAGVAKTNVTGSLTQTGGSKDAIVVSHTHTANSTVTDPGHFHSYFMGSGSPGPGTQNPATEGDGNDPNVEINTTSKTTGISVSTTVASSGSSGTNANLPPYYALAFIMKTA
jgi:microcystin-dependent protein